LGQRPHRTPHPPAEQFVIPHLRARPYDSASSPTHFRAPAMSTARFHAQVLELIRRTSAYLPPDVTSVIETHRALEQAGSQADLALTLVAQNISLARRLSAPICQDTGTITFYVKT